MADQVDDAKRFERHRRRLALEAQLNTPEKDPGEEPLIKGGIVICIDCCLPIPLARLEKRPEAVRCISCKSEWEDRR